MFDTDGDEFKDKEEHADDQEPKQRAKKSSSAHSGTLPKTLAHSGSLPKTAKKTKSVVHAADDMGISGDGCRWKKYADKRWSREILIQGITIDARAGCPVRKHIGSAADCSTGLIIT